MSTNQKAALLPSKHGKIEIGIRPIPSLGPKEVLVRVTAAAINPVDWKVGIGKLDAETTAYIKVDNRQRYNRAIVEDYPAVLGTDGAGTIESVGPDVTTLHRGDRVFFQGRYTSNLATFQQYAAADSEMMAKTPNNISDDQASTIPVASVAAMLGLFQESHIPLPLNGPTASGRSILILGGSSSVGQYAIQLARIAGFSPIVTTASEKYTEYLQSLGATRILDRNSDVKTLQSAFVEHVSFVLDAISLPETQSVAFEVLTTPNPVPEAHLAVVLKFQAALKTKNEALGSRSVAVNDVWGISHLYRDITIPF
ncbi:hypothetical protein FRC12_021906 [Ceratobasidium sp. 428]|nr:hypothetical protein FRC12_021906 [Ceratobasidium sp. 428]